MDREYPRAMLEQCVLSVHEMLRADLRGLILRERGPGWTLSGPESVTLMRMAVREIDGEQHLVEVDDDDPDWTTARYRMVAWCAPAWSAPHEPTHEERQHGAVPG